MSRVGASAPGKVVLCGEYAVLDDAPAVATAVDRRAVVTARRGEGARDHHTLVAPGWRPGRWRFRHEGDRLDWLDEPPAGIELFERLCLRLPLPRGSWSLSLDTSGFVDAPGGTKLGLGASAAIATAASAVLARLAGDDAVAAEHAAAAHREFQGGHGSGVDIAASRQGGVLEYRRGEAPLRLRWPAGLDCRFLYSGVPASTVSRLERLIGRQGAATAGMDGLKRAARAAAAEWRRGDGARVLATLADYAGALRAFDAEQRLGIFDAGHDRLADAAATFGTVYKPCGAGGGDVGAVFALETAASREFVRHAVGQGFTALDLAPDDNGVEYVNTAIR